MSFFLFTGLALAGPSKVSPEFGRLAANSTVPGLVQFQGPSKGAPPSANLSAVAGKGAAQVKSFQHVNAADSANPVWSATITWGHSSSVTDNGVAGYGNKNHALGRRRSRPSSRHAELLRLPAARPNARIDSASGFGHLVI
jgi:hypothetical protein